MSFGFSLSKNVTKDSRHPHHGIAKFNLLGKVVYHVGGNDEETMRAICLNKDLSFSGGNNFLFAGIAGARQGGINEEGEVDTEEKRVMRDLIKAISPMRLNPIAPRLVEDAWEGIQSWFGDAASADLDMQQTYYPLVFRFTVRVMGMAEYASSPAELKRFIAAFWATQRNSGFWTTILPWVPQPRLLMRLWGAVTLWSMVRKTLAQRQKTGHREEDYAQDLIDQGYSHNQVSKFVIGGIIAGILNTIGTGAYSVAFVGADDDLKRQCKAGLEAGLRKIAEARGDVYEDLTPLEKLQMVKLEDWESIPDFEILHLVFKESIRLMLTNSLNRYYPGPSKDKQGNLKPRLTIYGEEIEDDAYVTFSPPSNLHDADAFPEPFKFDPTRYKRGQGQTEYTFIGWGAGHHKCTGMRFAKLETIIALSSFLLFTDFETVDDRGKRYSLQEVPLPDLSQSHWRTPRRPMRVRITKPSL